MLDEQTMQLTDFLLPWIGILISLIIAILNASKNQFDDYDEFQKTIQLKALALTLFLTIFIGLFYMGVHESGLLKSEPRIHYLVAFSSITYIFSTIFIFKRYQ